MSSDELENKILSYLESQRCVLWGQAYDLKSTQGLKQAKEFVLDILIDLEMTKENVE